MYADKIFSNANKFVQIDKNDDRMQYLLSEEAACALIAALASGRALLVRGEPGTGKSELAKAAAALTERALITQVVQPQTEYQDLLWSIDYTERLADAQNHNPTDNLKKYLRPGCVWRALNPVSIDEMKAELEQKSDKTTPKQEHPNNVLLIDEVDKADISLAYGLLGVLGDAQFHVSPIDTDIMLGEGREQPLMIFTSNDTRELPAAFVRRCVVLELVLPKDEAEYFERIGKKRFPDVAKNNRREAAKQLLDDRGRCQSKPRTGLAEYIDLLRALDQLASKDDEAQGRWLKRLQESFKKSAARI